MVNFIEANFIPVKISLAEQGLLARRLRATWTPTLIISDPDGTEHHRFVGYLPPEEFIPQLHLGLGKAAFNRGDWYGASGSLKEVVERYPQADAGPEAQYWFGAAELKRTGKREEILAAWKNLMKLYPQSTWAKRVSFVAKA